MNGQEYNPFVIDQPQQQQQPTMPNVPLQGLSMFTGTGGAGGAGGAGAAGAGGSAGGGVSGAAASAGPWAALAAIIIGNEIWASKTGHREGKTFGKEHIKDILTTDVLNQDIEGRILPKVGIKDDSKLSDAISLASNPLSFDFDSTWDKIKNIF